MSLPDTPSPELTDNQVLQATLACLRRYQHYGRHTEHAARHRAVLIAWLDAAAQRLKAQPE